MYVCFSVIHYVMYVVCVWMDGWTHLYDVCLSVCLFVWDHVVSGSQSECVLQVASKNTTTATKAERRKKRLIPGQSTSQENSTIYRMLQMEIR